jgi:hypothetical protein
MAAAANKAGPNNVSAHGGADDADQQGEAAAAAWGVTPYSALSATTFGAELSGVDAAAFNASAAAGVLRDAIRSGQAADSSANVPRAHGGGGGAAAARQEEVVTVTFMDFVLAVELNVTTACCNSASSGAAASPAPASAPAAAEEDDGEGGDPAPHRGSSARWLLLDWAPVPPAALRVRLPRNATAAANITTFALVSGFAAADASDGGAARLAADVQRTIAAAASSQPPGAAWNLTAPGNSAAVVATASANAAPMTLTAVFLIHGDPHTISSALLSLAAAAADAAVDAPPASDADASSLAAALAAAGAAAPGGLTLAQKPGGPVPVEIMVRGGASRDASAAGVTQALAASGAGIPPGALRVNVTAYTLTFALRANGSSGAWSGEEQAQRVADAVANEVHASAGAANAVGAAAAAAAAVTAEALEVGGVLVTVTFPVYAAAGDAAAAAGAAQAAADAVAAGGNITAAAADAAALDDSTAVEVTAAPAVSTVLSVAVDADSAAAAGVSLRALRDVQRSGALPPAAPPPAPSAAASLGGAAVGALAALTAAVALL